MLNILTAITNITFYYPFLTSITRKDYITGYLILFAACASAISHLFESHKHKMIGFGTDPRVSYILNRVDVLGVILLVIRILYLAKALVIHGIDRDKLVLIIGLGIPIFLLNLISEMDEGYYYYLPLHCMWHLSVFLHLDLILNSIYTTI